MTGNMTAVPAAIASTFLALAACAAIDNALGGPDPRPIPPMTPSDNASPALTGFGARRLLDAGSDSRPNHGD